MIAIKEDTSEEKINYFVLDTFSSKVVDIGSGDALLAYGSLVLKARCILTAAIWIACASCATEIDGIYQSVEIKYYKNWKNFKISIKNETIVGNGNQGKKDKVETENVIGEVDPLSDNIHYKNVEEVPLNDYEVVYVCCPDSYKKEIVQYLVNNKKHVLIENLIQSQLKL